MKTIRLVTRLGALTLVGVAAGIAVLGASGTLDRATLATLLSGRLGGTAVFAAGFLLMFVIVVGGGAWAYRRTIGPLPSEETESTEDEADPTFEFGGYESFDAFVEAGGLDEFRDARGRATGSQVLRSPVEHERGPPNLEDLDPEIRSVLEERARGQAEDHDAVSDQDQETPQRNREASRDAERPGQDREDSGPNSGAQADDRVVFEPFDISNVPGYERCGSDRGNGHDVDRNGR